MALSGRFSRAQARRIRELDAVVYERELPSALATLEQEFSNWRSGVAVTKDSDCKVDVPRETWFCARGHCEAAHQCERNTGAAQRLARVPHDLDQRVHSASCSGRRAKRDSSARSSEPCALQGRSSSQARTRRAISASEAPVFSRRKRAACIAIPACAMSKARRSRPAMSRSCMGGMGSETAVRRQRGVNAESAIDATDIIRLATRRDAPHHRIR